MSFKVVIPARYASTRLPGKPLLDIAGKPMVVRVAEQANKSGASSVVIATDFEKIIQVAASHQIQAVMTRVEHASGTDRIAEVAQQLNWDDDDIVVNVQGDEPLIDPQLIQEVALTLGHSRHAVMATACHAILLKWSWMLRVMHCILVVHPFPIRVMMHTNKTLKPIDISAFMHTGLAF